MNNQSAPRPEVNVQNNDNVENNNQNNAEEEEHVTQEDHDDFDGMYLLLLIFKCLATIQKQHLFFCYFQNCFHGSQDVSLHRQYLNALLMWNRAVTRKCVQTACYVTKMNRPKISAKEIHQI